MMLMLLPFLLLIGTMVWVPGLANWFPLSGPVIAFQLLLLLVAAFYGSRGTWNFRLHLSRIAPWAVTVLGLSLLIHFVR